MLISLYSRCNGRPGAAGKTIPDLINCAEKLSRVLRSAADYRWWWCIRARLSSTLTLIRPYLGPAFRVMDINPILMAAGHGRIPAYSLVQPPSRRSLPPVWSSICWQYIQYRPGLDYTLAAGTNTVFVLTFNDASFWMIKDFWPDHQRNTVSWTLMSTLLSISGLILFCWPA
ncbi:hypothetical protein ACLK1S_26775 [Escherichia coli]